MNIQKRDKIPWGLLEKYILIMQKRIYYAEKKSDHKHVYLLQQKFSKSWSLQAKIVSESFFFTKKIYEKEFFQNFFPFFYNNENIRKKSLSIFFGTKSFFSVNQYKNKQKSLLTKNTSFFFKRPLTFLKNKKEKKKNSFESTKLTFNLKNCEEQKTIKLNKNFSIISILEFSETFKKQQIIEKCYLNNFEIKRIFFEKFLFFYPETNLSEKQPIKVLPRWSKIFWIEKMIFKYYKIQHVQTNFVHSFVQKNKNHMIFHNLVFKNQFLLVIENKKKENIDFHRKKLIFCLQKIDFYRKSTDLEKKTKYLLQIFYLTKNLSDFKTPLLFSQINNEKMEKKDSLESHLNKKKIIKFLQIKKQIEPQWKARYEFYFYSLNKGPFAFQKIQSIYENLRDEPKYLLKIEIKSLIDFFEKKNKINEFENFIDLLKNFFFHGLEKAFFHIFKKHYYTTSYSLFKQILIFDRNQIIISHNNDLFLKKFCQFLLKNLEKNILPSFSERNERKNGPTATRLFYTGNSNFHLNKNFSSIQIQINHSFLPYDKISSGIDFLGFHISQSSKKKDVQKNIDLEYFKKPIFDITKFNIQTFITPSLSNILSHLVQIRTIIKQSKTSTQEVLIKRLSPKIRGWSKFYSQLFLVLNKQNGYQKAANYCDYLTIKMLWRWACRRHPKKNRKWIKLKYFKTLHGKNWVFCVTKKQELIKNFSNNESSSAYPKFSYLCLPLHREI